MKHRYVLFQKSSLENEKSELETRVEHLEESVRLSQEEICQQADLFKVKLREAEDLLQVSLKTNRISDGKTRTIQ